MSIWYDRAKTEESFTRCLMVMDYKQTGVVLDLIHDLIRCGMSSEEVEQLLTKTRDIMMMR